LRAESTSNLSAL